MDAANWRNRRRRAGGREGSDGSDSRETAPRSVATKVPTRLQGTTIEIRAQPILEQVDDAAAGDCCIDSKVGCGTNTDDERTRRVHLHDLPVAFELPGGHR